MKKKLLNIVFKIKNVPRNIRKLYYIEIMLL